MDKAFVIQEESNRTVRLVDGPKDALQDFKEDVNIFNKDRDLLRLLLKFRGYKI
jgi:hypothetical protein